MPLNVNINNMTELYGSKEKALEVLREITDLAGHGVNHNGNGAANLEYAGGFGILGALRDDNTAIPEKDKARIAELAQVDRKKDIEKHKGVGLPRTADIETANLK